MSSHRIDVFWKKFWQPHWEHQVFAYDVTMQLNISCSYGRFAGQDFYSGVTDLCAVWITIDQLMSLVLLFQYLLLNIFRMLVHPSSGTCDLFVQLFHVLYCSGMMCVGVTFWFGWGGVVSEYRSQRGLMFLTLLFHYLMLNMFRTFVHPSSGAVSLVLQPVSGYHTTAAKPQSNTNTHHTRAIQHMK